MLLPKPYYLTAATAPEPEGQMADLTNIEQEVLRTHAKAIVHMRRQHEEKRFGLIFGAGIGQDLGLPRWDELVTRIAQHAQVEGTQAIQGADGLDQSLTIRIQKLFEWFRIRHPAPAHTNHETLRHREKQLIADWREIV